MRKRFLVPAVLSAVTVLALQFLPAVTAFSTEKTTPPPAVVVAQSPAAQSPSPTPTVAAPNSLPTVMLLATGGTIAGTGATSTTTVGYQAAKLPVEALISAVPELKKIANVKGEQVLQIASENMTNEGLLKIAKRVNEVLAQPEISGVVITHGTDTIEETAYFLNLVTKSRKPVVVVGAMRPATALSADGPINLYNAVAIASNPASVGKGVMVSLNDQISAAREVSKVNTTSMDTFQSLDMGYIGYVELGKPVFYQTSLRKHTVDTPFEVSNPRAPHHQGERNC